MSDNAEEGIAKAQSRAGDGDQQKWLSDQQARGSSNLGDRILTFVFMLAMFGLVVVWMTAKSDWVIYGSFVVAAIAILAFGLLQIKRLEQLKADRKRQASEWNSKK